MLSSSSSSSPSCKKFHPLQLYLQQHQQQRQQRRRRHRSRTMTLSLSTFVLLWTGAFCWVAPRRSLTQALLPRKSTTSTPTTPTSTTTAQFTSSSSTTYNSASAPHYQQHHYQQQTLLLDGLFPNNVARAHDVASAVRAVQQACAVTVALQPFDHDVYLEATTNATSSNANTTSPNTTMMMLKDDASPLTVADLAVQALVLHQLRQQYPEDGCIAEEDSSQLRQNNDVLCQKVAD